MLKQKLRGSEINYYNVLINYMKKSPRKLRGYDLLSQLLSDEIETDFGVILYGGLKFAPGLSDFVEEDNILFYNPPYSASGTTRDEFLQGTIHPYRRLILFDDDSATWNAINLSLNRFTKEGYNLNDTFVYLEYGFANYDESPKLIEAKRFTRF